MKTIIILLAISLQAESIKCEEAIDNMIEALKINSCIKEYLPKYMQ